MNPPDEFDGVRFLVKSGLVLGQREAEKLIAAIDRLQAENERLRQLVAGEN